MNRVFEVFVCILAALLAAPFFVIACLIVMMNLGFPLFFKQTRAGKSGGVFSIYKLRTMTDERDSAGNLLPDSERQTRATAMLRRLRLDEAPQLLMILRGDMALVGPRPLLPETIQAFGEAGQMRCTQRPGLTGWAQVSGNTTLSNQEKLQLDLWYVAHRSFALDLQIMAETIRVAIRGEHRRPDRIQAAESWVNASTSFELKETTA